MSDGPLFIVDNDENGRSGLGYLREWSEVAEAIDIATGFFEIGALLDLDGHWQRFDKIRILMGDEIARRTKKAMLVAVKQRAEERLDDSLESEKAEQDPFLNGVDAIVQGLTTGQIECRVYNRDKFHAKAYITHGRLDIVGSQALVGSSNFTRPGLTENVELNIRVESSAEVAQLQQWYEKHWEDAVEVTDDVLKVVQRHASPFSPFDVYAQSLRSMFDELEPSASTWDEHQSKMFPKLDRYQQEAYWAMTNIAKQHSGAFLCDGVGLGKTYVGLMLLERLVLHENKRVVLFAPKSVKESVWVPELKKQLAHIGGAAGSGDFSNLSVFSHTDLTRPLEYPERFERITDLADAVVIDEAHHFRNTGKRGDPDAVPDERSRYYRLYDLIHGGGRRKSVFLLTATPINNSLNDFRHLVELFSGEDDSYFAKTLGVTSLQGRLNVITKTLKERVGDDVPVAEVTAEATDVLAGDAIFQGLVVQRSRAYAKASQTQATGSSAVFPERKDPQVAEYSIKKSYGKLLDLVDTAFKRDKPLFALPMYYPLAYSKDESVDKMEENRQAQVVGLIRTNFLKRFESSVSAFELSCDRLLRKLLAFVKVNSETDAEVKRFERWLDQNAELLAYVQNQQLVLFGGDLDSEADDDVVPPELEAKAEKLDREKFEVSEILAESYLDLDQIAALLEESRKFDATKDDKLKKLVRLLTNKDMVDRKVLVFTEFADTARYLKRELDKAGVKGVAELDSTSKVDRATAIRRFSPYYNGLTSSKLQKSGQEETRVLVATDVLSEGLNLQDATRLINYDIHWNPVRLMQRIGRVDRRLSPEVEGAMIADHPHLAKERGKVAFWNFLPPDDLDSLLKLYTKVSHKTLLISKTLGIEGKKLLKPEDDFEALKEFNAAYEGHTTSQENLHLEYQRLLDEHPGLEQRLQGLPRGVFSGREIPSDTSTGAFFCFRLPALDTETQEFSLDAGVTRWYLQTLPVNGPPLEDPGAIAEVIRSTPETPRTCEMEQSVLLQARDGILKYIKNTYLRQLDVPIDAPKPSLICWMELNPA